MPLPQALPPPYAGQMLTGDGEDAPPDALAVRLRSGDPEALAEVYREHGRLVFNIALRGLGTHHDAEDAAQQVFVAAWRGRQSLDPARGGLGGWLVGITRHVVSDVLTQRWRTVRNLRAVGNQPQAPEQRLDAAVVGQLVVADALARLDEPRRTVVRLAILEERTHDEISRELGLALGTVKSHVRRGLLQLRATMEGVETGAS